MFAPFRPRQSSFTLDRLPKGTEDIELSPVVLRSIRAAVRDLDRRFSRVSTSAEQGSKREVSGNDDVAPNPSWHGIF